ncbi:hypothetical protein BD626DRAFT_531945 [Schizophyllum amplum]|uniref:Uncharacterized protein n=1 Tax=Schizophyllum amplum TaxID=97359 RepID=A0A550BRJ5_9AGAR|nr:hypothetical protein BD626DRAFT_531945 [Auriculariopsis ampla]
MLSDEITTGSVNSSPAHKRGFAAQSHTWNIQQPRFREAFSEYATSQMRDLPNMGEKERGRRTGRKTCAGERYRLCSGHGRKSPSSRRKWLSGGAVLWEKWRWGVLIVLAIMVSRISMPK